MNLFSLPSCEPQEQWWNLFCSLSYPQMHSQVFAYMVDTQKKILAEWWWQTSVPVWVLSPSVLKVTSMVTWPTFSSVKRGYGHLLCSSVRRIREKFVKCGAHHYGFCLLSAYSYYAVLGTEENFFLTLWSSVVMKYSTPANAHQRGTRVNSWIRVLFTLGGKEYQLLVFKRDLLLDGSTWKTCLGVGPGLCMQHTWIFKYNCIYSWPHLSRAHM